MKTADQPPDFADDLGVSGMTEHLPHPFVLEDAEACLARAAAAVLVARLLDRRKSANRLDWLDEIGAPHERMTWTTAAALVLDAASADGIAPVPHERRRLALLDEWTLWANLGVSLVGVGADRSLVTRVGFRGGDGRDLAGRSHARAGTGR